MTVLPVNYKFHDGAILFRTAQDGSTEEDLRTGIEHADFRVAFEVDDFRPESPGGLERSGSGPGSIAWTQTPSVRVPSRPESSPGPVASASTSSALPRPG